MHHNLRAGVLVSMASPYPHAPPARIETASTRRDPHLNATLKPPWTRALRSYGPVRASILNLEFGGLQLPLACLLARATRCGVHRAEAPLRFLSFPMIRGQRGSKHLARSSRGLRGTSHGVRGQPLLMLYLSPGFAARGMQRRRMPRKPALRQVRDASRRECEGVPHLFDLPQNWGIRGGDRGSRQSHATPPSGTIESIGE